MSSRATADLASQHDRLAFVEMRYAVGDTPSGQSPVYQSATSRIWRYTRTWPGQHRLRLQDRSTASWEDRTFGPSSFPGQVLSWLTGSFGDGSEAVRLQGVRWRARPVSGSRIRIWMCWRATLQSIRSVTGHRVPLHRQWPAPSREIVPTPALIDNGLAGTSAPSTESPRSSGISSSPAQRPWCLLAQPVLRPTR